MHLEVIRSEPNAYEVDPAGSDPGSQPAHLTTFLVVGGVDGVSASGAGPYLHRHPPSPIPGEEVDLASTHGEVGANNGETVFGEKPSGQGLPHPSHV